MEEVQRLINQGYDFLRKKDSRQAYKAYADAIYLTEKRNVGKALNDIDELIEDIYSNEETNLEDRCIMEVIQNLYLHKAKIYGRIDHYTESVKALSLAGYDYMGEGLPSRILNYIENIEEKLRR